jgi:hypothetical protein
MSRRGTAPVVGAVPFYRMDRMDSLDRMEQDEQRNRGTEEQRNRGGEVGREACVVILSAAKKLRP